jgi:hypothetical protein
VVGCLVGGCVLDLVETGIIIIIYTIRYYYNHD